MMMKTFGYVKFAGFLFALLMISSTMGMAQNKKAVINKYLTKLEVGELRVQPQVYTMTAIYTNRDLYGAFIDKTKISGDYTRGLENGMVKWNEVYTSVAKSIDEPFGSKKKQEYIENMSYVPSDAMLDAAQFTNFPPTPEAVFSRNLIWDMMAIEGFAWDHLDKLELNKTYRIEGLDGEFDMADVGTYAHADVLLCWTGISAIDNELYAVIEYEAIDNIVNIDMSAIKTKGTEQYWGTVWVALKTREVGKAVMYSGSAQEIEIAGMENKLLIKTIRELWVEKKQ